MLFNFPIPESEQEQMQNASRALNGLQAGISGGQIWRDENSRIKLKASWMLPRPELTEFSLSKGLMETEFISLDSHISEDSSRPTAFDYVNDIEIKKGELIYDISRWDSSTVGIDTTISLYGQAYGYIIDHVISGEFQSYIDIKFDNFPELSAKTKSLGRFFIQIDKH